MSLNLGDVVNNRYRIVEQLGQGGFGAVYRAWDMTLKGPCAIKENLDISPAGQKQFSREASLLFNLRHPNLPRVFDTFIVEGQGQYLVMDYIEGEDLQSFLDRTDGQPPVEQVLTWTRQVCDALTYLHSQEPPVIHRDIKPANIRITPTGEAMLVDFGIAKVYDPHLKTTLGAQAVTPGFSPPEQYGSGTTDERSDVYALSATIYTMLTGMIPPASVDIFAGLASPPQPAHLVNPAIPIRISTAIGRAMQPNRTARLGSVAEFRSILFGHSGDTEAPTLISQSSVVVKPADDRRKSVPTPVDSAPRGISTPSKPAASKPSGASRKRFLWLFGLVAACVLAVVVGIWGVAVLGDNFGWAGLKQPTPQDEQAADQALTSQLRIWHTYEPGGVKDILLHDAIMVAQDQHPDLQVELQSFPFEDLLAHYPEARRAGNGPDLLLLNNDVLGNWARNGLVQTLDEYLDGRFEEYHPIAIEGMRVDGRLYGIPNAASAVAMYYNRDIIERPPENTEQLNEMVRVRALFVNFLSSDHLYPWAAAFGGELLDDQGRCIADRGGWNEALHYLLELKAAGAIFDPDFNAIENIFRQGEAAIFVNGPWALGDYREALGDSLGVARLPAGPRGPAMPLTHIEGYYVNPSSNNIPAAVELALVLTNREISQRFTDEAWNVPARMDVHSEDPLIAMFTEAAWEGIPQIQIPEFEHYWEPFHEMFEVVLLGDVPPEEAVARACEKMNLANGK